MTRPRVVGARRPSPAGVQSHRPGAGDAPSRSRRRPAARTAAAVFSLWLVSAGVGLGACGDEPPRPSPAPAVVVARVDGVPISAADVRVTRRVAALSGESLDGQEALEQLIREELVRQEVERLGVAVSGAAIEERITGLADALGGKEALRERVREAGLTTAQLRSAVAVVLLAERLQETRYADVRATRAQARRFYDENVALFAAPAEVELADLAVRTEAAARDVRKRIVAGQSFGSAARQFSVDPELKAARGMLGWVRVDSIPGAARRVVEGLPVGELSEPVRAGTLWHLFKVLARREERVRSFADVAAELVDDLTRRERSAALARWLERERRRADVEILQVWP